MSRRRIVLPLLSLLCVLTLGGWLVVAPALPKAGATVAEPAADLEGPSIAAGAAASVPPMRGAAPKSTAAASGAGPAQARCGEDQVPVYANAPPGQDGVTGGWPVQTRPPGVGFTGAQRRVDAALRATGDPFDAAVADALDVGDLRPPDDRLGALVQDALAGEDPRVYQVAFEACQVARMEQQPVFAGGPPVAGEAGLRSCDRMDPRRWAARDPGNAVPWFYALDRADRAGDRAGQREALQQLAASSRLRMDYAAAAASVGRLRMPDDADLAAQELLSTQALSFELGPLYTGVVARCQDKASGDAAMAATCERIAGVLFDHSDSLLARAVGASIHRLVTGDATRLEQAHRESKALTDKWAALNADAPAAEAAPCDAPRRLLRHYVLVGQVGEVEAAKREIAARAAK